MCVLIKHSPTGYGLSSFDTMRYESSSQWIPYNS